MSDIRYTADPKRFNMVLTPETAVCVRGCRPDGSFGNVDIAELDKSSLLAWLRSRGGHNPFAENLVGQLLGHEGNLTEE